MKPTTSICVLADCSAGRWLCWRAAARRLSPIRPPERRRRPRSSSENDSSIVKVDHPEQFALAVAAAFKAAPS